MNGNKQLNKLATQIAKKQDNIDGYIATQIVIAQKNLKAYIDAQAREEKEIAELNKQQEDIKNHKPGQLAKVSIYEFVNDWVRPEISFQILSYLGDPHRDGIKKARTHRRYWNKYGGRHEKGVWEENKYYPERKDLYTLRSTPYCELKLYKVINEPHYIPGRWAIPHHTNHQDEQRQHNKMSKWVREYARERREYRDHNLHHLSIEIYRNTNPLLHELWSFHQTKLNKKGTKKFVITKGDVKKYLAMNKVSGRTDLTYGVKCSDLVFDTTDLCWLWTHIGNTHIYKAPRCRRELVGALMKLE